MRKNILTERRYDKRRQSYYTTRYDYISLTDTLLEGLYFQFAWEVAIFRISIFSGAAANFYFYDARSAVLGTSNFSQVIPFIAQDFLPPGGAAVCNPQRVRLGVGQNIDFGDNPVYTYFLSIQPTAGSTCLLQIQWG